MTEPTTEAGKWWRAYDKQLHPWEWEQVEQAIEAEAVNAALDKVAAAEWYIDQGPTYECRGCHRRWYIADSPDEHDRGCVVAAALAAIEAARPKP